MQTASPTDPLLDRNLATLDAVMAFAEFSPAGELLHANRHYLEIFGYELSEVQGAHHRVFCDPAHVVSPEYETLWQRLRAGEAYTDLCERRRRGGEACWLEATYAPVLGAQGEVLRIVKMASDVTGRVDRERRATEEIRRLSMVAGVTDNAVLITDAGGRITYVNEAFTRMFGWCLAETGSRRPIALLAPHLEAEEPAFVDGLRAGRSQRREEILRGRDGERYWCSIASDPVFDDQGRLVDVVSMLTDITPSKMQEVLQHRVLEAIAREQPLVEIMEMMCAEVEGILPGIATFITEADAQGRLVPLAAPSMPEAYRLRVADKARWPIGDPAQEAAWAADGVVCADIAGDAAFPWPEFRGTLLDMGYAACWTMPVNAVDQTRLGTVTFHYTHARAPSGFHRRLMAACVHLCALAFERERSKARIRQLAFFDALTALPNRSLLLAKAEQALAAAARTGAPAAVVFIDLDRFKQINDSLGHAAGDELLCHVARQITRDKRAVDIAGRLSGDEFVLVLPDCDAEASANVVERLQARIAEPHEVAGQHLSAAASCGIALFPSDGVEIETLLMRADLAMDQAKTSSRGGYCFFSAEMNALAQERLALESALREAVRCNGLSLHYQPQVDLRTGQLCGAEALARWTHPELGSVPPSRFIPLAEDCGLIATLGLWALRTACDQLAAWRAEGLVVPSVSVNLSSTSFHDLGLPQRLVEMLSERGLAPSDLVVEITEGTLIDDHPATRRTIGEIHRLGVRLSVDDFGTGYSSLSYLRRLPIHELKLDRSFVSDLETDVTAQALSRAVVQIGNSLGLIVVAEGVETEAQMALLAGQGYQVAQGYRISRPMDPRGFGEWVGRRTALAETAACG